MASASSERIVIIGGGVSGLACALALGRLGYEVEVLERDEVPTTDDPETAFAALRRGAPQVRHTHGLLARLTVVLRDEFPEVLDALIGAGAQELWPTLGSVGAVIKETELPILIARRTTLEWALRQAAAAMPGIAVRGDVMVKGVGGRGPDAEGPARVDRVVLDSGDEVRASCVVMAGGRRPDLVQWLAPLGVELAEEVNDTGIVYLTRWYRHSDELSHSLDARLGGDYGFLKYLAVPGDAKTVSITIALRSHDRDLRSLLLDPERFDRAAALLPGPARWFGSGMLDPFGPVHPMGGLINRLRGFVHDDGAPRVVGFHAVGDAHTCTNPLYGRGCALGLVQATLLGEAFAAFASDPVARARHYEHRSREEVEPWYHAAVQMDGIGGASDVDGSEGGVLGVAAVFRSVLMASETNPVIGQAMYRVMNLLVTPEQLFADPKFLSEVSSILQSPVPPAAPPPWMTRAELLEAVA